MMMPEDLRLELINRGFSDIDIGDFRMDLSNGKITRTIHLDGVKVAEPVFPSVLIDWKIVATAVRDAQR
jgi:hypothetical protein